MSFTTACRLALLSVLALFSVTTASAAQCATTTYDNYLTPNFTCTLGNLSFSNFGYAGSGNPAGVAIPASAIHVTIITTSLNEGFQFAGGWNVGTQPDGSSSFQDSLLTFTATDIASSITDLHLSFNGSIRGTGLSGVTENYCLNGQLANCTAANAGQLSVTNPPTAFNDAVFFNRVHSVSVSKDINVTSGINGVASISQVVNTFSQVPEPATLGLLGIGLAALGLIRRRRAQ